MTGRHRGPKPKLRAGYRAPSLQRTSYLWVGLLFVLSRGCEVSSIFHRQVWYRAQSLRTRALCEYSTFGHHPHPLGYPCAKFCFCRTPPTAELARGEKSRTQSLTHSLTQLIWCAGNQSFRFGIVIHITSNELLYPYSTAAAVAG